MTYFIKIFFIGFCLNLFFWVNFFLLNAWSEKCYFCYLYNFEEIAIQDLYFDVTFILIILCYKNFDFIIHDCLNQKIDLLGLLSISFIIIFYYVLRILFVTSAICQHWWYFCLLVNFLFHLLKFLVVFILFLLFFFTICLFIVQNFLIFHHKNHTFSRFRLIARCTIQLSYCYCINSLYII